MRGGAPGGGGTGRGTELAKDRFEDLLKLNIGSVDLYIAKIVNSSNHLHMYVHSYIHICIHTYTHTYTQIHMHIYM